MPSCSGAILDHSIRLVFPFSVNPPPAQLTQLPGDRSPRAIRPITATQNQGIRSRKNLAGWATSIGMAFEKAPAPSSTPVVFVVQTIGDDDRLVAVSKV